MSTDKKTIKQWEREYNFILPVDAKDPILDEPIGRERFIKEFIPQMLGVFWDERLAWLKRHGFEPTRANIANANLSVPEPKEPENG